MTVAASGREIRVLAAGDRFVLPRLLSAAVTSELGSRAVLSEYEMAWPDEAFGSIGEVDEASGTEEGLIEALRGVEAIVTQLAPVTRRVIEASKSLRFIGVSRGGPVNINVAAAHEHGITVVNAPGRNGIATAEMTLGLILAVTRRIAQSQATLARNQWRGEFYRFDETGPEIDGSTIGLLGYGAVGSVVARALAAMGAEVLVYDPFVEQSALLPGVTKAVDLDELFQRSLIVSVHARLTPESQGIVSAARIAQMRRGSYIVNAARGPLVDYDAVAAALGSGQLAGAAFDVYPSEPADFTHPIFTLLGEGANIVTTPHIAGATQNVAHRAASIVAADLRRFVDGEPLEHEL
jgi:D-3-phosphoglycerate dehydrogenase